MKPPSMLLWVTFSFIGWHQWPQAPDQVEYLRNKHRHLFKVRAGIYVDPDDDRVIEFHMLQDSITERFYQLVNLEEVGSCESLCRVLAQILNSSANFYFIEVSEDGECGATLHYPPH